MLAHLRRISSLTLIYGLGDAVIRLASLLLLPIYTRYLSPSDYGKLALVTLFATIVTLVLEFGQRTALFRFYLEDDDPQARRILTGTVVIFLLVAAAAILTPLILFFNQIGSFLVRDALLVRLIKIALISTFFDVGSTVSFAIFRAKQYAGRYAALSLLRFLINVGLGITAVVILRWGVLGLIYANLTTSVLFFVICLALTAREIAWTIDFNLLKQLLAFGLPLIPAGLAYWGLNLSDRFFLQKYRDLSQVGVYSISYVIAGVLQMIMSWFNTAYAPYVYSIAKDSDARAVYARVMLYSITLLTFVGLGLSVFASEALSLLTPPAFHGASRIVPLIILAYLFYELYYLLSFGFDLTKKTGYLPFIIGAAAIINVFLNLILIPRFGMPGAAVATALSFMLLPIIEYPIVRQLYPIPYEWWRVLKLLVVSVAVYLAGMFLKTGRVWLDCAVGVLLLFAWALILLASGFLAPNELSAARAAIHAAPRILRRGFQRIT